MTRPTFRRAGRGTPGRDLLTAPAQPGPRDRRASRSALIFTLVLAVGLLAVVATTLAQSDDSDGETFVAVALTEETVPESSDPSALSLHGVIDALPAESSVVELSRGRLITGAAWDVNVPGPALYGVEEGALGIRVDGPAFLTRAGSPDTTGAGEAAEPGVDYTLRPGDQMLVLPDTEHLLRNDGREPTAYVSLLVFPASSAIPSWLPGADLPVGVEIQRLAADVIAADAVGAGPLEISLARTTIDPSDDVPLEPEGFTLLVVESGTLVVGKGQADATEERFDAGAVARLEAGTTVLARSGGTEILKVLTVQIGTGKTGASPSPGSSEASPPP